MRTLQPRQALKHTTVKPIHETARMRGRKLQARRLRIWKKNPRCASCGRVVSYPNGFELDHVVPLYMGGADTDSNCQVLCNGIDGCHAYKSAVEREGPVSYYPEWLKPSAAPLTIVFGPPGSGKSTFVRNKAARDDIVLDVDEIAARLSGQPIYQANDEWLLHAVRYRNTALARLAKDGRRSAWLITTGQGNKQMWWQTKLRPTATIIMDTPADECKRRIMGDSRRPAAVQARQCAVVDNWWREQTCRGELKI